ncbi:MULTISPECIES: hypothetical protein [Caballeronia]|uniref:hypothetical protein n=1 Tax=Caballeronia TaxID=1827195 RepID=UPI00045B9C36|nr:hypothetical protein [Caballeronia sp. LZ029]KAK43800.1 hypothetical protein BG58_29415 [Caballeronia jiangsuensis]MDR5744535.1 hypothetical protein [Caballeronia sp. LZ029]BAO92529.1 putative membrane protein [Burkholderia sp. RPE67]
MRAAPKMPPRWGTLDAQPLHLDLLDSQYAGDVSTTSDGVASVLFGVTRTNAFPILLIPLGLLHSDHRLVHAACQSVWRAEPHADVHR